MSREDIEKRLLMYLAKIQEQEVKAHKNFKVMRKTEAHDIIRNEIIDYIYNKICLQLVLSTK